jgi:hypothetical protein
LLPPPLFEAFFFDGERVLATLRSARSKPALEARALPRLDDRSRADIALNSLLELPSKNYDKLLDKLGEAVG